MNRYLVKLESITEVDAIDESDATTQVMKKLESLNYHFPSIKRIPNIELNDGVWRTKKEGSVVDAQEERAEK